MSRENRPRSEVASDLHAILSRATDTHGELDILRYFEAEALRDTGNVKASRDLLEQLRARGGPLTARAIHGIVHILRREGRFKEVALLLHATDEILPAPERLWGDLMWTQGRFAAAINRYEAGFERAESDSDPGEAMTCASSAAFVLGLWKPDDVEVFAQRVDRLMNNYHSFSALMTDLGRALAASPNDQVARLAEVRSRASAAEHSSVMAYADLAVVIVSIRRGDASEHNAALGRLRAQVAGRMFMYLVEIATALSGDLPSYSETEWLDDGVFRRWHQVARPVERDNG
jgi:uncharacterized MAPEG superfamily protein